jgi:hypothetical protein
MALVAVRSAYRFTTLAIDTDFDVTIVGKRRGFVIRQR